MTQNRTGKCQDHRNTTVNFFSSIHDCLAQAFPHTVPLFILIVFVIMQKVTVMVMMMVISSLKQQFSCDMMMLIDGIIVPTGGAALRMGSRCSIAGPLATLEETE